MTNWTAVAEKLPQHGVEVLATFRPKRKTGKRYVAIATYWESGQKDHCGEPGWSVNDDDVAAPVAWMDCPEPCWEIV